MKSTSEIFITEIHNQQEVLYVDLQNLKSQEFMQVIELLEQYIEKKHELLILFDARHTNISGEALIRAKNFGRKLKLHHKRSAFLGIEGAKKILLNSIIVFVSGDNSKIRLFNDKKQAIDWLSNL